MNVLITGGAGFIGSHLADAFLARGDSVTVLDNFLTGSSANIAHLDRHPGFTFIEHDASSPAEMPGVRFDLICHLASPASPVGYGMYPLETMRVNALGAWWLLERCARDGARFLLASTSEIYGDPLEHPQSEEYWGNVNSIGPRSCYDESKRFAEALTVNFAALHDVDYRIVRIFNTYGPRNAVEDGRIIPNFVNQALEGRPLTVFGDGVQTRSYCYVGDLVRGLVLLATVPEARGQVVNLGNPEEYSALEIAQTIIRLSGTSSRIEHLPPRPEEIARRRPNIDRARRILGWQPEVSVSEGLRQTIDWYRERKSAGEVTPAAHRG